MFALFGRNFARPLPELQEPAGTFGLWSLFHVPLATLLRFCFHTDLTFPPQPPVKKSNLPELVELAELA